MISFTTHKLRRFVFLDEHKKCMQEEEVFDKSKQATCLTKYKILCRIDP